MRAHIARPVDQLLRGKVNGRQSLDDLLISNCRGRRRSAHYINLASDGCAVNYFQRVERLPRSPEFSIRTCKRSKGGRIEHQKVFQQQADPLLPRVLAIRKAEKAREFFYGCMV